ncbi:aminotransferase class V-fold PLP-dependent enzyme [Novispirillum itersonii]|uniref:Selenocysteine lyase/cysteine desulfurase n=1 Tax=Novispirillum itersonii TaxID=189 RepID=A0A7W9ZC12_NOVIT|nr:aminotransferase class V-fold PLP-dependent enzyme [Novispirillum itersonii]MBB6208717.1 selenocysteine lyase/cysteine desulfurase [Novispirillum itersonii]
MSGLQVHAPSRLLDVAALRAETPGCGGLIHFNNASCTLPPRQVLEAVRAHHQREALDGPSEAGVAAAEAVQDTRRAAATLLNADVDEIALGTGGSQLWGVAFASLPPLRAGDRVLVGRHEWGGNLSVLHRAAARSGASVEVIPCDDSGAVSPDGLAAMLDDRVKLVSLTWCPATNGVVNPAAAIGRITRAAGVPYFIDAGQALGQMPVDVRDLQCDMLKGAGRKALRGPRGTAVMYVRRGFLDQMDPPYVDVQAAPWQTGLPCLRPDARRFEMSEAAIALQLGLGDGIRLALSLGLPAIRQRINALAEQVRTELAAVPGVRIHDAGTERSGLVAFTVAGHSAGAVRDALARDRITIGAIAAAYGPLDMAARGLPEVARASVSVLTTEEEIGALVSAVAAVARS